MKKILKITWKDNTISKIEYESVKQFFDGVYMVIAGIIIGVRYKKIKLKTLLIKNVKIENDI